MIENNWRRYREVLQTPAQSARAAMKLPLGVPDILVLIAFPAVINRILLSFIPVPPVPAAGENIGMMQVILNIPEWLMLVMMIGGQFLFYAFYHKLASWMAPPTAKRRDLMPALSAMARFGFVASMVLLPFNIIQIMSMLILPGLYNILVMVVLGVQIWLFIVAARFYSGLFDLGSPWRAAGIAILTVVVLVMFMSFVITTLLMITGVPT